MGKIKYLPAAHVKYSLITQDSRKYLLVATGTLPFDYRNNSATSR